ncbi:MAG: Dabb family protein [Oscillospiraceae bacterium]
MVKHVIIWKLKDMPEAEKAEHKRLIKEGLEALAGKIDGLTEIKVVTELLPTSTGDLMLDSTFTSAEALKSYSTHPEHVKVADEQVRPFVADRKCVDFEI